MENFMLCEFYLNKKWEDSDNPYSLIVKIVDLLENLTTYREDGSSVPRYVDNLEQMLAFYSTQGKAGQWPVS